MIKIVEVGPRDGLQNETAIVSTDAKVAFVDALSDSGVTEIEVSAFVSGKLVPQLRDGADVFQSIRKKKGVIYSALVPNIKGLERALAAGADKISVFTAVSETFNRKNINTGVTGSLERFRPVVKQAKAVGLPVRGYISTAFWCAFEGKIPPAKVTDLAKRLIDMGVDELSISDTIGKAAPDEVAVLMDGLLKSVPVNQLAAHFHDTYGRGIANVLKSVSCGIQVIDSSAGGLGGCPFAPGATGNVATESVVKALMDAGEKVTVNINQISTANKLLMPYLPGTLPVRPEPGSPTCMSCPFFDGHKCCSS